MAIMATAMKNKLTLLCVLILFSSQCLAKSFTFTPNVGLDETYSDNLELSNSDKQDGLVSQANIGLNSQYENNSSSFSLRSTSTYVIYSNDHSLDTDYHALSADGDIQLWPNGVSLLAGASIQNQPSNITVNSSNSLLFSDTVQTENYRAGLAYDINNRHHISSGILNFTTSSSEDNIGERDSRSILLSSQNSSAARYLFWDSSLSATESDNSTNTNDSEQLSIELKLGLITDYNIIPFIRYYLEDNSGNVSTTSLETEAYGLGLRWLILPRLFIDVSYNEPSNDNSNEDDAFADILLNWQPTSRTQLEFTHSQRFFGDSYGLDITHKNRRLTNTISYVESVTTFSRDNFQSISSDSVDESTGDIITTTTFELVEDDSFSLNKTFNWSSVLALPRTTFNAQASYISRENLDSDNSGSENLTKVFSFSASRSLSSKTTLNVTASITDQTIETSSNDQQDLYRRYSLNYSKRFNPQLNTSLSISHTNRSSSVDDFSYTESRIAFTLNKDF